MVSIFHLWHMLSLILLSAEKQTMAFNLQARAGFKNHKRVRMGIWEAIELLNTLVDESDPDVSRLFESQCN